MPADPFLPESAIAAAMAEPARTRMLYCLLDGRARTATELSAIAGVGASTASVHLARLRAAALVSERRQGRHRYYHLRDARVAAALEALSVVAGGPRPGFEPSTPPHLRQARTCYDHLAGRLGVAWLDAMLRQQWLVKPACGRPAQSGHPLPPSPARAPRDRGKPAPPPTPQASAYALTPRGQTALENFGIDVAALLAQRRRFAYACLDWSERRPHLGGALAAALFALALRRGWLRREGDERSLFITLRGRRDLLSCFGLAEVALPPSAPTPRR